MLIVMPDGNMQGSAMGEDGLKQFTAELKEGLMPYVEANFRAKSGAENRAVAGLSMGGIQTLDVGVNNTETFGYLGVFSSGWIKGMQDELANAQCRVMAENADKINKSLRHVWIAMGGEEDIPYQNCAHMLSKFDEMKINYTYSEYPGGHTWPVWRNNLYNFSQLLFK